MADRVADPLEVDFEELHDEKVTFVIHAGSHADEFQAVLEDSDQVVTVDRIDDDMVGATKQSCGAYDAITGNHGILRRQSRVSANGRVYNILFFNKSDLQSIVSEFREIGDVTIDRLTRFGASEPKLTDRQRQVIETALREGYFEWPRRIDSEELAEMHDISRATCLEHLRKAEQKLLRDALNLEGTQSESDQPTPSRPAERGERPPIG